MPHPTAPLPLVGRDAELALVHDRLSGAAAGRGGLLLLAGEGGVGKTRLARHALDEAARRGMATASGTAYAVEAGVPYAPWADAVLPLLRGLEPGALAVLTRGGESELARLFPALAAAERAAPGAEPAPATAEQRAQLHWRLAQLLERLAARRPLLVVLENLQWADASSLELLHFVARQLGSARVLLLGTYNEAELDLAPTLRTVERSLAALGVAHVHHVRPLGADDTRALLRAALGAEPAPGVAERLHARARGNAFVLEELLKTLDERAAADASAVDAALPATVRDAALARVARLGPDAREVADVAAALGRRAPYPVLRAVCELPDERLALALDELCRRGVLAEDGDEYDVAHPVLRDALYDALGRARARLLHGRIAHALEAHYDVARGAGRARDGADAHADELALHFRRAGAAPAKALRYLVLAGRAALVRRANREAADYLQAALDLTRDAGAPDAAPDAAGEPAELAALLARVRQRLGEYDAAAALWRTVRDDARARGDAATVATAERALGLGCYWSGSHDAALAHYDAGLQAAAEAGDDAIAVRLHIARGNTLQALGRHDAARDETWLALRLAERADDAGLLARAHRALLLLHAWTGPASEARAHGRRAAELADAAGEPALAWSAHWALATLEGLTGNAAGVEHHLGESERLADRLHAPVLRLWGDEVAIEYLSGTGRWAEALARADVAIPQARALGQRTLLPRLLVWTGLVWRGIGDLARAKALLDEAWTLSGAEHAGTGADVDVHAVVPAHTGMAGYHVTAGEWERALAVGEAGLRAADRAASAAWAVYRLLPFVIEAALWTGDLARASAHAARLRAESTALDHPLGLAWADGADALVAHMAGPPGGAAARLRAAVERLEAVPYPFDAARVRRMTAHALVAAGDRDGAVRELRLAHDAFARLGAERELAGTRERLRELGVRPPPRASGEGVAGMTGREVEIARLVARRRSNKEIAAALDVSPRTVSTHLSNIFAKLGVGSRGELADRVREEGLLDA